MKKLLLSTILTGSMTLILATPLNATNKKIAELTGTTVQEVTALQNAGLPAAAAAKELKAARDQVKAAGTTADSQELKVETFLEAKKNNVPLADIVNEAKLGNKAEDTVKNFVAGGAGGGAGGAGGGASGGVKAPDPVKVHARSIIPGAVKDDIATVAALEKLGIPLNTITAKQVDTYKDLARLKNNNGSPFAISLDAVNAYEQYLADTKVKPVIGEDLLAFIEIKKSPDATSYATLKTTDKDDYIAEVVAQFATHKDWTQAIKAHEAELAKLAAGASGGGAGGGAGAGGVDPDAAAFKADVGRDPANPDELDAYKAIKDSKGKIYFPQPTANDIESYLHAKNLLKVATIKDTTIQTLNNFRNKYGALPDNSNLVRLDTELTQNAGIAPSFSKAVTPADKLTYLKGVAAEPAKAVADKFKDYEAKLAAAAGAGNVDPDAAVKAELKALGLKEDIFNISAFPLAKSLIAAPRVIIQEDLDALVKLKMGAGYKNPEITLDILDAMKDATAAKADVSDRAKFEAYMAAKAAGGGGGAGGGAGALPADQQALRDSIAAFANSAGLLAVFDSDPAEFTKVRDATSATNKANPIYLSAKFLAAKTGITFSSTNGKTLMAIIRQFANEPRIVNLTKANFDAYLKLSAADQALVTTIDDLLKLI